MVFGIQNNKWIENPRDDIKSSVHMKSLIEKVQGIERNEIISALRECNWVMSRAAKMLGITDRMIGYKIKKYHIRKEGNFQEVGERKDDGEST
jgi:Nif-specific regulatory protein